MEPRQGITKKLSALVETAEDYDRFIAEALPELLDHAAGLTRRFLRETGQWADDVGHEKLALRWGYELLERFLLCTRGEVPCRPFFLLDSLIAKYFSQPAPLCYDKDLLSPLGRFLDGLTSRAVVSRDALITLFYHQYGFGPGQVVRLLGLGPAESQRVYKNFERWRRSGWDRAMTEIGLSETELSEIEEPKSRRQPDRVNAETARLLRVVQGHYRRSEPEHFPCLSRERWADLFDQGYGLDYRVWHLALCRDCLTDVHDLRKDGFVDIPAPRIDLHIRPLSKGRVVPFTLTHREGGHGKLTRRPSERLSTTSA